MRERFSRSEGTVAMFGDVEILVDLQTGTISVVIPGPEVGTTIELETVTADEPFAPRE